MEINGVSNLGQIAELKSQQVESTEKAEAFSDVLKMAANKGDKKALQKAAEDFEAIFINMMLQSMRKTVPENALIPKSNGEQIFESMLDQAYSEKMARAGGIGLSKIIVEQLGKYL